MPTTAASYTTTTDDQLLEPEQEPDGQQLLDDLNQVITDAGPYWDEMEEALATQYCVWPGQDPDGRKHEANLGVVPFPWEDGSDMRVRLAEELVLDEQALYMNAFMNGQMQAVSRSIGKQDQSEAVTAMLYWQRNTQMQPQIFHEMELLTSWISTFGKAALNVCWWKEYRMVATQVSKQDAINDYVKINFDEESAATIGEEAETGRLVEEFNLILSDEQRLNGEAVRMKESYEDVQHLSDKRIRKILTDIRDTGAAEFPAPVLEIDRPHWRARRLMLDVFFPLSTDNLSDAPWIAETEYLSRDQLQDRVRTEGWDETFVSQVVNNHAGQVFDSRVNQARKNIESSQLTDSVNGARGHRVDLWADDHTYELIHFYHRKVDSNGYPAIYKTVLHNSEPELIGKHELLPYKHGWMPFVGFTFERLRRAIVDSRGIPELVMTAQAEVKRQRDSRSDRTDAATFPPLAVPGVRGGGHYPFQPGSMFPVRGNNHPKFLDMPKLDSGTIEIELAVLRSIDTYFGRTSADVPPEVSFRRQQYRVNRFLKAVGEAVRHTFALDQQYLEPLKVARVTGAPNSAPLQVDRDTIQGQYDVHMAFDVRDLNQEFVRMKLEYLTAVLPLDRGGAVDTSKIVESLMRAIDPNLGPQSIKPAAAAQQDETEDEIRNVAMMLAGEEPPLREGQDANTRLQVLQQRLEINPKVREAYEGDEQFKAIYDARMQAHQFALDQIDNAATGRIGAEPVL